MFNNLVKGNTLFTAATFKHKKIQNKKLLGEKNFLRKKKPYRKRHHSMNHKAY